MAAPKKPVKTSAAKPATSVAAKRSVPKKSSGSTRKKKKIGFGAIVSALLIGKRKWVTMAAFVLVFGGIGAYLVNNSFALHDQNDFGCQYSQQNTLPRVYSKTSPGPGVADPCVALIQDTLKYVWGHTVITTIDGKFGTQTDKAVREFQSRHVHALTADGIVGSNTWKHLKETSTYRTTSRIGSTSAVAVGVVGSTGSGANGQLASSQLTYVSLCPSGTMSKSYLRNDAASTFFSLNNAYKAATGKNLSVASCYRDLAGQKYAYSCYINKNCNKGNKAAKPGTSNHGLGVAVDFNSSATNYTWLKANSSKYRWHCCSVSGEPWHYVYR